MFKWLANLFKPAGQREAEKMQQDLIIQQIKNSPAWKTETKYEPVLVKKSETKKQETRPATKAAPKIETKTESAAEYTRFVDRSDMFDYGSSSSSRSCSSSSSYSSSSDSGSSSSSSSSSSSGD